ncbi:alpha/beta hydrolase [Tianweitania sediminis]|uniref:Alpha/beta fold hydrolase n=1 Tax=Tianweitania sediminis TaxID=1502156 RepID=A0A8J7R3V3_9HYPH|nr:alpha/beta fold hydrolase [Tianweitania sediminis]MBP0441470.1 alpha/beta fold hydrolase [Tianweitania sediminis]
MSHAPQAILARPALLFLVLVMASACASRPGTDTLIPFGATVPGAKLVKLLVATNRSGHEGHSAGSASTRGELRFEELTVSIPPQHQPGEIEWSKTTVRDPLESFVVVERQPMNATDFQERLNSRSNGAGSTGIFVHGYNYNYTESVFRLAQLAADSGSLDVPILFSWPSDGAVAGYVADRDAATYARDDLVTLLETVGSAQTRRRRLLVAHSLGGWLVMEALRQLRLKGRDHTISKFEVALAAPDIDVDVFRKQLEVVGKLNPPLAVLVSTDDRALGVSRRLAGGRQRVGAVDISDPALREAAAKADVRIIDISSVTAADGARHNRFVQFVALQATTVVQADAVTSLQKAGAFVFNAAGNVVSSPFDLASRALSSQ